MNAIEVIYWLSEVSVYSALPGLIIFLYSIRKFDSLAGIIFYILLAGFLSDIISSWYISNIEHNSFKITNIWYFVNYFLILWMSLRALGEHRSKILVLLVLFIIGSFTSLYFFPLNESNTFIRVLTSITLIIIPLMMFYKLLKNPSGSLFKLPIFWIATSFFFYGCVTLLKNLFTQLLVFDLNVSADAFFAVGLVNILSNITKNLLLFYALLLVAKGYSEVLKPAKSS